jgi:hypothetical protein
MRLFSAVFPLLLAACSAVPQAVSQDATKPATASRDSRITIYLGQRNLDQDDYAPVDEQAMIGVEFARETAGSLVGWEVGVMGSSDEGSVAGFDVTGNTAEIYGGVRKTFGSGSVRPYVGGGLSVINSEVEVSGSGSADDESLAGYAHLGVSVDVTEAFFLGLDLRVLFGSDLSIGGVNTDADYGQLALILGWSL